MILHLPISSLFTYKSLFLFFFNDTATTEIYTLSLHDALPICAKCKTLRTGAPVRGSLPRIRASVSGAFKSIATEQSCRRAGHALVLRTDRKSTRLNSSH